MSKTPYVSLLSQACVWILQYGILRLMKRRRNSLTWRTLAGYYLPPFLWFLFMWLMSSQEGSGWSGSISWDYYLERKAAHIFEYTVFAFLMWRVVRLWTNNVRECLFWTLAWVLWAGVVDEVHQSFVFGRDGRIVDVGIDMMGGVLGTLLAKWFLRKKK